MATALSKPEPMNAISYHSKVRVSLKFGHPLFVAGDAVSGKMEMECKTDKGLGIGVIMAELFAIEELTSRDHSATQTFMHSRRIFQGPGLPPSNSVHPFPMPDEPPLPMNYYHGRRGTTTFLFRFPLLETSPSSINFGSGIAQLRYEIRATVGIIHKGERVLVTDRKIVDVVEMYREDPARPLPEGVIVGENGKILMQGRVLGGVLVAGQPACVELLVKNHSQRKNTGLTVTLSRDLRLAGLAPGEKPPLQLSDTLTSVPFRGPEFIIQPGVEGVANLVFDVPSQARSLKGGLREGDADERPSEHLFEVRSIVTVCLTLGFGSRDICLELPVTILHPAAVPELLYDPYPPDIRPYSPLGNIPPQSSYPALLSQSPQPGMPPYGYGLPSVSPPPLPFVDQGRVWLPPLTSSPYAGPYGIVSPAPYSFYQSSHSPPLLVPPVRSSSAEPAPSQPFFSTSSGPPPSVVQQPLVPMQAPSSSFAERIEGKGERASRVTHHLRMSSRNRSVSPLSHRYAAPEAENQPGPPLQTNETPISHHKDPSQATITNNSPGAHISSNSDVASPRPMPSPKQTYTLDPFTSLTFSKSERVEALERIAAQTDNANKDMSSSVPDLVLDLDKTLPRPPVPSQKMNTDLESVPTMADIFQTSAAEDFNATPPTPTLAAVTSPKASRAVLGHLGGLDALEARLLAEVGTRKVEQNSSRPDVRSVLPIDIPRPDAAIDPAIDSAISSLSLPGLGADEGTLRLGVGSYHAETSERGSHVNENESNVLLENSSPPRESEQRVRKKKSEQKARGEVVKEKEQHRLRKAAQGRVAAWLGSIEPETPPQPSEDHSTLPQEDAPLENAPTPLTVPEDTPAMEDEQHARTEKLVDAKPNPRSSGFIPVHSHKEKKLDERKRLLPVWPKRPQDPEVRYDVRSARGGRGGQVTAVAAVWAAQAGTPSSSAPAPKTTPPPKRLTGWSKIPPTHLPLSRPSESGAYKHNPPIVTPTSPAADLAARRAKIAKASSVPAILSSSLAIPVLSSTASLARSPPKVSLKPPALPTTIAESQEDRKDSTESKSPPKLDLAFGQARLRELIKKYQG